MASIELRRLYKRFDTVDVINDLDLVITATGTNFSGGTVTNTYLGNNLALGTELRARCGHQNSVGLNGEKL